MMAKSPVAWLTDDAYAAQPLVERALAQAAARVGTTEQGGNNRGPWVARFLAAVGLGQGYAWCAAFVTWTIKQADELKHFSFPKHPASVLGWHEWARATNRLVSEPQRGDLFFWLDGSTGHIGWITGVEGRTIETIEGNTNKAGSRDGDGVYRKRRTIDELARHWRHGFIRLV